MVVALIPQMSLAVTCIIGYCACLKERTFPSVFEVDNVETKKGKIHPSWLVMVKRFAIVTIH